MKCIDCKYLIKHLHDYATGEFGHALTVGHYVIFWCAHKNERLQQVQVVHAVDCDCYED